MLRLTRWLTALLGLALLAANSASAVAAATGQNLASGSSGSAEHRLGQNALASPNRVSEKIASLYDLASDFPVGEGETTHLHHAWPKYLGGPAKRDLESLPKSVHDEFHGGLDKIFRVREEPLTTKVCRRRLGSKCSATWPTTRGRSTRNTGRSSTIQ